MNSKRRFRQSTFVALAVSFGFFSSSSLSYAQLKPRPDLKPDLTAEEKKDADLVLNPGLKPPATTTDERKDQVIEAMKERPTMDVDQMRAGIRRQNLDYKILQVGTPNAANELSFAMDLWVGLSVKVDGAAAEDRVVFYAGMAEKGSNNPVVLSERFEDYGPGPHILKFRVPVTSPLVKAGRFEGDLILLSEKKMPGLPGQEGTLKSFLEDKVPDNHRKTISRPVLYPQVSLTKVEIQGNDRTVKVGDIVKINVVARIRDAGPARQGISYAIGDPAAERIDATGPKVFRQGDGLFPEATMQFRVKAEQIVDGKLNTTLFLLRDSEPGRPFGERYFTDNNLSDHQRLLAFTSASHPPLKKSNPLILVIVHGKTLSGNEINNQSIGSKSHFYYYWGYPFIRQLMGDKALNPWGSRDAIAWSDQTTNSRTPLPAIITPGYVSLDQVPDLSAMTTYRDGSLSLMAQSKRAIDQIYTQYQTAFGQFENKPDIVFIGHSMGGLVSRYILSTLPAEMSEETRSRARFLRDRTRYIVTIATPHDGSQAVDAAFEIDAGLATLKELYKEANPVAAPAYEPAIDWAVDLIRNRIDTKLPAMKDLTSDGLDRLNRTVLKPENARRDDGTLVPIYVLGGRQPDSDYYTYKPGLETHTDFKSLPGTIKLVGDLLTIPSEDARRAGEALGLMGIDFLLHKNDISGLLSGSHHPLWGLNLGPQLDWGMIPGGHDNNDLDIVQRTFKTTKPKSLQLKRPLPFEGVFWSKPAARPDEWPVYYWHGRQDGEIDSDGMVSIASSLGMRLGSSIVVWDVDFFHFDHSHMYDTDRGRERGSWYRIKRGYWDLDNHGAIHRNAHTGRWLWLHLISKEPGPYASSGERSSWRKP